MLACALIGFVDDYMKIVKRRSLGLRARTKLVLLAVVSVGLWLVVKNDTPLNGDLSLRFVDGHVDLGAAYPVLIYLVVAGTTSGVNLTDGLDGLAGGCTAIVVLAYIAITAVSGAHQLELLSACIVGACVGFLWFNAFPATIFMGDTGSLGLGGAIAGLAVMTQTEMLLILIGGIFVIEARLGADPDRLLPGVPQARLPDGAAAPPFRAEGVVGDEDDPALLDHRDHRRRDRLHDLLAFGQGRAPAAPRS